MIGETTISAHAMARHGETLPGFTLPDIDGSLVSLESYRGRSNLVVVFAADKIRERPVTTLLEELLVRTAELEFEVAQMLIVVTSPDKADHGGPRGFPVLLDDGGRIHRTVAATDTAGRPAPAVFVTDRFREIFAAYLPESGPGLPGAKDILEWLVFINIQCPECGAPEWAP